MPVPLTLLPYLQDWDGTRLSFRLLVAPQGSPLDPLTTNGPSFVDAPFEFETRLVKGLDAMPTTATTFQAHVVVTNPLPRAHAICAALERTLPIDATIGPVDPRRAGLELLKYAPPGYRDATGYRDGRNPYLRTDDRYHCALKAETPAGASLQSAPPDLGWGKVLALALRQPLLAEAIGLVRPKHVTLVDTGYFEDGGWLYVTLRAGTAGAGLLGVPDGLRTYAARVPPLSTARSLFTSVLFPVKGAVPAASYDAVFREVIDYDDGFAKAVYVQQPRRLDPLGEEDDGTRPGNDPGVQLGWDDEQVATWLNRQIDPAAAAQDAPMGVLGYRVDARVAGDPAWRSLVLGTTAVTVDDQDLGTHTGEFRVEIAPNKLMGDAADTFWIPAYYTTWSGPSLVGPDHVAATLRGIDGPAVVEGVDPGIALRYGEHYEFRVRLVDHTDGGPASDREPANPGPQPSTETHFRRFVRPGRLRLDTAVPVVANPAEAPATLALRRPRLGYPAYVFAGGSAADLLADLPIATTEKRAVGRPDPDVAAVQIEVQVECPGTDGGFRTLYRTTRPFAAGADDVLDLALDWRDVKDAMALAASPDGPIPVPTARAVRLNLSALAADRPDYYGADDVRHGPVTALSMRKESSDERGLVRAVSGAVIQGIFLPPEQSVDSAVAAAQAAAGKASASPGDALGRLAVALDLDVLGTGLRARPGHRVLFGATPSLAHVLGPDGGSVQFSAVGDVTGVWLVPLRLQLDRDWSWDGLNHLRFERNGAEVGRLQPRRTIGHEALGALTMDHSELIFLDAIDPKPSAGGFPSEPALRYRVVPVFRGAPANVDPGLELTLDLPITTPPTQVPRLASAGVALSPYQRDAAYRRTEVRERMTWLEFEAPPENPADVYYARVLAHGPDPVLTRDVEIVEVAEPPLPIDPELIRTIVPGQPDDQAGAGAMQPLLPTESPRHFLVPLPSGLTANSAALFGFFTYEIRVGHQAGWITAQGRFGRPLRVTGVQHPAPTLRCGVIRSRLGIEVNAPFAEPVYAGRSLRPYPPATQLWVLLYAQVHQADGADMRNVLLGRSAAQPRPQRWEERRGARTSVDSGTALWSESELRELLTVLGLGPDTPLSCLAIETLPGDTPSADPVGTALGYERILRTSPLTPVPALC